MTPDLRRRHKAALHRIDDQRKLDAMFVLLVAWLPLRRPCAWRFFRGPHLDECLSTARGHQIAIKRAKIEQMRDVLLHEYAHALADEACPENPDHHSDLWGVNYARCYRVLEAHWDGPEW